MSPRLEADAPAAGAPSAGRRALGLAGIGVGDLLSAILAYHPLIFLWLVGYDLKHRWFGPPRELAALDDWTVWQALVVIGFLLAGAAIPALVANLALARRARVRPRWLWLAATAMAVLPAALIGIVFSDVGNAINYWAFH